MGILNRLESYLDELTTNPLAFLVRLIYTAVVVLISLILHECAHGYVALRCGDPTAKMMGRLSLDPRKHLDPIGTASMLLLGVGWAKPVPVNSRNFKGNYVLDDFLVSIAGITVNFTLFLLFSGLSVGINRLMWAEETYAFFREDGLLEAFVNPYKSSWAAVILYGDSAVTSAYMGTLREYVTQPWLLYLQRFVLMMAQVNLGLAIFNFIPFPPLDGYHIFNDLILRGRFNLDYNGFRIAQLVLIGLVMTGALSGLLNAANEAVYGGVLSLWLSLAGA
ncbi:MAG: site-2 protease family protein [Clostridia bacterium]|nr:site-2 protease family protein [Clostridia bacterium]